jgi:hypothetical protein
MERIEVGLRDDEIRQRCITAAARYRLQTGREPFRLVIEKIGEVSVAAERESCGPEEAAAKMGKRVETLVDFSGVPQGITGVVVRDDEAGWGFDVGIQWEREERQGRKPLVDWFSTDEYEEFLIEV